MKYILIFVLVTVVFFTALAIPYKMSAETVEITIKDKERITIGSGENITSKFIVYTENEVFENTDNYLYLKFNSADYQNKFMIGETYTVIVAGWRVPFFSMYRNIVSDNE